jgi:hypothetical protein
MPSSSPYNNDGRSVNTEIDGNLAIKTSTGSDGNLTVAGNATVTGTLTSTGGITTSGATTIQGNLILDSTVNGYQLNMNDSASINGYLAWPFSIWQASSAITLTTTDIYGVAFTAGSNFTPTYMDLYCTTLNSGSVTLAEAALFPFAGGTALFAAPDIHSAWSGTGIQTFTWTTPTALTAGTRYMVMIITTATTSGPSISANPTVAALNVNLASHVGNCITYGTGSSLTSSSTYTVASGTASGTTPFWFGIR